MMMMPNQNSHLMRLFIDTFAVTVFDLTSPSKTAVTVFVVSTGHFSSEVPL
jgi:hypothetical protein